MVCQMSRAQKQNVASIYHWVIDDVIANLKADLDESLLHELRGLWDKKLNESGVLNPEAEEHTKEETAEASGSQGAGTHASGGGRKRKAEEHSADVPAKLATPKMEAQEGSTGAIPQQDGNLDEDEGGDSDGGEKLSEADEDEGDEAEYVNFMCAQFEKVNRVKSRWKCNMKDGVFHIGGRDYLFRKGTGEFTFD